MNELKIFDNQEFGRIRTVEIDGTPWLVGKDVAQALGYTDTFGALKKHVDDEDKQNCQNDSFESPRGMTIINESGLYSLVLSSKLPTAKKFRRWVTNEVLPSVRKHGAYMTGDTLEKMISSPEFGIRLLEELDKERKQRQALEEQAQKDLPKVIFADAVSVSDDGILIGALAKIIKQNGVEIGQKRLFEWLRKNGYLMKSGIDRNLPTQKAMEMKLFKIKERTINNPDGSVRITKTVLVTGKGQ
ncbi:MAG: phage antirepressor KilAC domain-containing protein [Lachnospiraceae bacterium]|jgi:anti-repressor protein